MNIAEWLFDNQDLEYQKFQSKLIPNIPPENIIGIRTPILRNFAKQIKNTDEAEHFIGVLPHKYYDEYNLHCLLISGIKDYDAAVKEVDRLLPYIDNWATCDMFSPVIFKKNTDKLLFKINEWIKSDRTYTVRFAIGCLMAYYLDDKFDVEYPEMVANVKSEEYYINMMIAWYFATALAKQYDAVISYIEEGRLSGWIHRMTIRKACESYRVSDERKKYLKSLRDRVEQYE
ncbi:MAG: DNA alkylation repair protein [Clostridiales bacterium]|nr:DNA alkylation repair protein [Clostridiales bacterium]